VWLNSTVEIISAGGKKRKKVDFRLLLQHKGIINTKHSTKNATNEGSEGIQMNSTASHRCKQAACHYNLRLLHNATSANITRQICVSSTSAVWEWRRSLERLCFKKSNLRLLQSFFPYWR